METFLLVVHVILSFVIVVVILLQSGQGGGMGAGFGGAAAVGQEIFGGRGAATFLSKITVVLGASFMITSMALAWYSSKPQSVLDLTQSSGAGSQAQVHQILEEGRGEFQAPSTGGRPELQQMNENEIPPEVLEQLQEQLREQEGVLEDADEATPEGEEAPEEGDLPTEASESAQESEE